jgi:hypothetical protein
MVEIKIPTANQNFTVPAANPAFKIKIPDNNNRVP